MKIKFNNLLKKSSILSLPGIISIFISLISIPIHLNTLGYDNYGNYIFFHFILMISINFNFGIGKSTAISINNHPMYAKEISNEAIIYTKKILKYFLCFFIVLILFLIFLNYIETDSFEYLVLVFLGSFITIIFLTFEGILQGNKKFKDISFFNLFFFSLSFSVPSLLLFFYDNLDLNELITIAVSIKLFSILMMYFDIKKNNFIKDKKSYLLIKNLKKNAKWITLNGILNQFFDLIDKFLIKIFLGPASLAIYSVPQQLTGKLSIISKSFSTYLLPVLSNKKKTKEFEQSINIFMLIIPSIIIIIIPFYPTILKLWLFDSYNDEILLLTKVFSFIMIFSCLSHILIANFEAKKNLDKNFKIEIFFTPFFLISLIFLLINKYSLIIISLLILAKEIFLFFVRLIIQREYFSDIKIYFINSIILIISIFISVYYVEFLYIIILFLIFINKFKLKKFF